MAGLFTDGKDHRSRGIERGGVVDVKLSICQSTSISKINFLRYHIIETTCINVLSGLIERRNNQHCRNDI